MISMKVAIVTDFKPESGLGRYAFELHKNTKNTKLFYFNSSDKKVNNNIEVFKKANYPILKTTLNEMFYIPNKLKNLSNYDVVHASNQFLSKINVNTKKVITVHDINSLFCSDFHPIINYFHKKIYDKIYSFNQIIAVSKNTKKQLQEYYNIDKKSIEVIYEGIDKKRFRPRNKIKSRSKLRLPLDKKIILHVGSSLGRKNIEGLIKIFYKIKKMEKNSILIRIGDSSRRIDTLINNYNLNNSVMQLNNVPENLLTSYYNSSDLFIFPSYFEGFGFPILEAMASGVPIIASNRSSIPELVANKEFLFDPNNTNLFAKAAIEILSNNKLKYEIIKKNLKKTKEFDWKITAKKTYKIYKRCLS